MVGNGKACAHLLLLRCHTHGDAPLLLLPLGCQPRVAAHSARSLV
jgi:hypothetical protein